MLFTIIYIAFFVYLNYNIYTSLKIGFIENQKHGIIAGSCLILQILFHFFFEFEGMLSQKVFTLLLIYSLSIIALKYMFHFNRYMIDSQMKNFNPDLYESDTYSIFINIFTFIIQVLIPISLTFFQIIVIFSTEIQNNLGNSR